MKDSIHRFQGRDITFWMDINFFLAQSFGKALQKGSIPKGTGQGAETEVAPQQIFFPISFDPKGRINK